MSNQVIITKEILQQMLENPNQQRVADIIGHALVALLKRQTTTEQNASATLIHNNIGFTGADGRSGTITAKYYLKHKTLLPWQVDKWLKQGKNGYARIVKYHSQLNDVAVAKAANKS